jgi:hypothetical protein
VARCTKIIKPNTDEAKYVINVKQIAKARRTRSPCCSAGRAPRRPDCFVPDASLGAAQSASRPVLLNSRHQAQRRSRT